LTKDRDDLLIVYSPEEKVRLGDSLRIGDLIAQVVDMHFADLPGVLEHILRKSLIPKSQTVDRVQPGVKSILDTLIDQKVAVAKIRGRILEDEKKAPVFKTGLSEFDLSRAKSEIRVLDQDQLLEALSLSFDERVDLAETLSSSPRRFGILPERLGINLITGMKGSGKSYLAKRLLLKLIERGVLTLVFDVNGEYVNIWRRDQDKPNEYARCIRVLVPHTRTPQGCETPLLIPLNEISYDEFATHMNVTPGTPSYQHLMQFWKQRSGRQFDLNDLESFVSDPNNVQNEAVRIALRPNGLQHTAGRGCGQKEGPLSLMPIVRSCFARQKRRTPVKPDQVCGQRGEERRFRSGPRSGDCLPESAVVEAATFYMLV